MFSDRKSVCDYYFYAALFRRFHKLVGQSALGHYRIDIVKTAKSIGEILAELRAVKKQNYLFCLLHDRRFQLAFVVVSAGAAVFK